MQFLPRIKPLKTSRRATIPVAECDVRRDTKSQNKRSLIVQYTDPSKLLLLIHSFGFHSVAGIEKKLNKYFIKGLGAENAVLVTFLREEAQVRSIGIRKFKYLQRFKLQCAIIESLRNKCKTSTVELIGNLHIAIQNIFKEILKETYNGDIIIVPLMTTSDSPIRVLLYCFINPLKDKVFTVNFVIETFRFCLHILLNSIVYDVERRKGELQNTLLSLLNDQYLTFGNLNDIILHILNYAVAYTNSDAGVLYLTRNNENPFDSKVYCTTKAKKEFVNLLLDKSIAGQSARTGKIIKLKAPLQCANERIIPDFKVKSSMSFPIFHKNKLLVIVQLFNKHWSFYTLDDEELAENFNDCCGVLLNKWTEYDIERTWYTQSQMSMNMLTNYISFDDEAVEQMMHCEHSYAEFDHFYFEPRSLMRADTTTWTLKMFEDLNLLKKLNIDRKDFAMFILHVKFGYLDLPYHNWMLAFSILHFAYMIIFNLKLIEYNILSDTEAFTLMLSAMGYFLDFRGHTNSRLLKYGLSLQHMYFSDEQIMEFHHFSQLVHILNLKQCNILKRFSPISYVKVISVLQCTMLKRDVNFAGMQVQLLEKPNFCIYTETVDHPHIKSMLISLIIGVSAVSDFFKTFTSSLNTLRQIYQELDETQDYAVLPHNSSPLSKLHSFLHVQLEFSQHVIEPALRAIELLLPNLPQLHENILEVNRQWTATKCLVESFQVEGKTSLDIIRSSTFEDKINRLTNKSSVTLSYISSMADQYLEEVEEASDEEDVESDTMDVESEDSLYI